MAVRRLNKKVAIIGLIIFLVVVLGAIMFILQFRGDPYSFISDGERAAAAKDYESAERDFIKAVGRARKDSLKIEILFKLVDVYLAQEDWTGIRSCWENIVQIEPTNVRARLERLRYNYIVANSGVDSFWQRIESEVSEFLETVDRNLFSESPARWETFDELQEPFSNRLDCYLYLLRGRARLEMAMKGMVSMPEEVCEEAMEDLKQAKELEPENVKVNWYMAQAIRFQGENQAEKGNFEARENSIQQAKELLTECIEAAEDSVDAHINLLSLKLTLADREGRAAVKSLEPEFLSLVEKFDTSPRAFMGLANYYSLLGPQNIDKAVDAIDRCVSLDREEIFHLIRAATLSYYKFSIHGRKDAQDFEKSISLAKSALKLSGAQETTGPRTWENRMNRLTLYSFLANRYIEQLVEPSKPISESEKQQFIASAEEAVHQIEQIIGSGENINVTKWEGMLDFAKGNRSVAIRKMYTAYEQINASEGTIRMDPHLPYLLAKAFENSSEQGVVVMFLANAIQSGIASWARPEAVLDYAKTLLRLENWAAAAANIGYYEQLFGSNQTSRSLKILAYIGAGQFEEASEELASEPQEDVNTIKLRITLEQAQIRQNRAALTEIRLESFAEGLFEAGPEASEDQPAKSEEVLLAELSSYEDALSSLIIKLSTIEASAVADAYISTFCEDNVFLGRVEEAKNLVDVILQSLPDNTTALFYKRLLSEPEPGKVTIGRRSEIEESVLKQISDPMSRAVELGSLYNRTGQLDKAEQEYKKVIAEYLVGETIPEIQGENEQVISRKRIAIYDLFGIALQKKDWQLAGRLKDIVRVNNLDDCEGNFFSARLAASKGEPEALALFNDCLKQRPIFSYGYLLRSNVYTFLGNEQAALDDARKALSLNPLDGSISKNLAALLNQRNQRLVTVTLEQQEELKNTLALAMKVNPGDLDLYRFYAGLIRSTEPDRAISILQYIRSISPTVQDSFLLGELAGDIAVEETDELRKEVLISMALSAYRDALSKEPDNREATYNYANFLRAIGREKEAERLLTESESQDLLWTYYYQVGEYEKAESILERSYANDKTDVSVLKGLLLVTGKTLNKESAQRYSEELLALEDNIENRLMQIKIYLNVGLIREAEYKLQSFREKFPDEPTAQYIEAWLLMKRGRLKEALDMANRSIERDNNNALTWQLRGQIYLLMADFDKAIKDFDRSELLATDPETDLFRARAYLSQGRNEYAIAELRGIINSPETSLEARFLLEMIYLRLGRKEPLRELYDDTRKEFPDNLYWLDRAAGFAMEDGDLRLAEQLFSQAWNKSREKGQGARTALNGYLEVLLRSRQLNKLFEEAGKYVDTEFAPIALIEMAEAEMMLGNKEKAVQYAHQAADKTAGDEGLQYEILRAMHQVIGREQIEAYCNEKIRQAPESLSANLFMFNLYFFNGQYNEALESIDRCLDIIGLDKRMKLSCMNKKASTLYAAYKQTSDKSYLQKAIDEYESLLNEMPKDSSADVLNNLAFMLAEGGQKLGKALEYAKQAYETRPNHPEYLDTYGYILYLNGKYSEAEEYMYEAIQQFQLRRMNVSWGVYERLGMIQEKLGVKLQAVDAYKQALAVGGNSLSEVDSERIKSAIARLSEE